MKQRVYSALLRRIFSLHLSFLKMDLKPDSKYAIHEAAREGKSEYISSISRHRVLHTDKPSASAIESLLHANPRLAARRDEDDRLPLHWALANNHLPIVQLLADTPSFDVDAQDGLGWTPLMIACSVKDGDESVDLLLAKGASVNMTNTAGQTALHFCASKNALDTARKLIAKAASTRTRDRRGQLPLHRAAAVGSVPMLRLLLENKSPVNTSDVDGLTALHHTISEGHGDAAVFLLKEGAQWDKKDKEDKLAIELAPDGKVRSYILQTAEREGIDVPDQ